MHGSVVSNPLKPVDLSAGEGGFRRKYWEERVDAGQVETAGTVSSVSPEGIHPLTKTPGLTLGTDPDLTCYLSSCT